MTRKIYKFPARFGERFEITTQNHSFVYFGFQKDAYTDIVFPSVWVEIEAEPDEKPDYTTRYQILATGEEVPEDLMYLMTRQEGAYVWHLYQELERTDD